MFTTLAVVFAVVGTLFALLHIRLEAVRDGCPYHEPDSISIVVVIGCFVMAFAVAIF